jgi:hypothetical protein
LEVVALDYTIAYTHTNTELQLFIQQEGFYFEYKIEQNIYIKKRKKLFDYNETIIKRLSKEIIGI